MKTKILFFLTILSLVGCTKDNANGDPVFQLPPETQTGANTFGVTIRGKVYIPRDPKGVNYGAPQGKGIKILGGGISPNEYTEIVIVDGASAVGFKIVLHIQNLISVQSFQLKKSNFQDQADSILENHAFFKLWDATISNYAYYGSIENQGIINITRLSNGILSGNFSGKFVRYDNPNDIIQITDGRFDINSFTIQNTRFP